MNPKLNPMTLVLKKRAGYATKSGNEANDEHNQKENQ